MLRPLDVVVGLRLSQIPDAPYQVLAESIGISKSQIHLSLKRLGRSHLVSAVRKDLNFRSFLEFLSFGMRYVFPGEIGRVSIGIPTAHTGPPMAQTIVSDEFIVWPTLKGSTEGHSLKPLYPQAIRLPKICPELYDLVTLVDVLRVGRVRERKIAMDLLRIALSPGKEKLFHVPDSDL